MSEPFLTPDRLSSIKSGDTDERKARGITLPGRATRNASTGLAYRPGVLYADPRRVSTRWPHAVARINRILEGAARANNLKAAVNGAEYPKLATEFGELWSYYLTRTKPPPARGIDHNPFRMLSDKDASRMFIRKVEDICDRSTGVLGSWYVK